MIQIVTHKGDVRPVIFTYDLVQFVPCTFHTAAKRHTKRSNSAMFTWSIYLSAARLLRYRTLATLQGCVFNLFTGYACV